MKEDDDDIQVWENSKENSFQMGRLSAFNEIANKIKSMPWEQDTKDSFLIWLKQQ